MHAMGRAVLARMTEGQVEEHLGRIELVAYSPKTLVDPAEIKEGLEASRLRGCALALQKYIPHMEAVGAAVPGLPGDTEGAVCRVEPPSRISGNDLEGLALAVMATAGEISGYMGWRSLPEFK